MKKKLTEKQITKYDLKDELEGAAKYRKMAKSAEKAHKATFLRMAKDEMKHHTLLRKMK